MDGDATPAIVGGLIGGGNPGLRPLPTSELAQPATADAQAMAGAARSLLARRRRSSGDRADPDLFLEAILLARGAVSAVDLAQARAARRSLDRPLGDILLARGALNEVDLISALAECHRMGLWDLSLRGPVAALARDLPAQAALALEAVPVDRMGQRPVIATCRPDHASAIRTAMRDGQDAIVTLAPRSRINAAQVAVYGESLARLAEGQAPLRDSCRTFRPDLAARNLLISLLVLVILAVAQPMLATAALFGLALMIFAGNMVLKAAAFGAALRAARSAPQDPVGPSDLLRPPVVTVIVPLFCEPEIASTLIARLDLLDYPRERLDVILAVEQDDATTRAALAATRLPPWIRVITVPRGHPRTKPRALNFALNFAMGEIVGIYDAEDRPDPDQITRIALRFAHSPPEVACLQGRLDYYNARHNPLSRMFAIEYASWFRVLLPGVQHLGLVVPLGGTTLFLRRDALVAVGGWDAHNVTEDAELGLRLARRGYRTEIVDTTTFEEANAAVLPWIRQRTRWQKGYLITWAMAMRAPLSLWRDLGTRRFLALQVQIFCAVAGFLVAPLLWSLMVKPFGHAHPLDALVGPIGYGILATAFVASLLLSVALSIHATGARHLRHLRPWIALSELYFLLATLSAWCAAADMLMRPFFWAKTAHGQFGGAPAPSQSAKDQS